MKHKPSPALPPDFAGKAHARDSGGRTGCRAGRKDNRFDASRDRRY